MDLLAPYDINFVVTGYDMSVKSQIAIGIAKALNTYGICDKNKLVRATAEDLNGREFAMIFEKLKGGCLVVEGAGDLDDKAQALLLILFSRKIRMWLLYWKVKKRVSRRCSESIQYFTVSS